MKRFVYGAITAFAVLNLLGIGTAWADRTAASVSWNGVHVSSSENLWEQTANLPYSRVEKRIYRAPGVTSPYYRTTQLSYPLTNLFDNDPRTAWVQSDNGLRRNAKGELVTKSGTAPLLEMRLDTPTEMDGLRLMNGYNKNAETFARNNRIREIRLWVNDKLVKTTRLSDRAGWHTVGFPRRKVQSIKIEFTDVRKGAASDDLCVSGLEFTRRDQPVDLGKPTGFVLFSPGSECGCGEEGALMRPGGAILPENVDNGEVSKSVWSRDGRYIAGITNDNTADASPKVYAWVADAETGRVLQRKYLDCTEMQFSYGEVEWRGNRTIDVTYNFYTDAKWKGRAEKRTNLLLD